MEQFDADDTTRPALHGHDLFRGFLVDVLLPASSSHTVRVRPTTLWITRILSTTLPLPWRNPLQGLVSRTRRWPGRNEFHRCPTSPFRTRLAPSD